jgi:hypothetical protein
VLHLCAEQTHVSLSTSLCLSLLLPASLWCYNNVTVLVQQEIREGHRRPHCECFVKLQTSFPQPPIVLVGLFRHRYKQTQVQMTILCWLPIGQEPESTVLTVPFFKGTGGFKLMKHIKTSVFCELASLHGAVLFISTPLSMNTFCFSG